MNVLQIYQNFPTQNDCISYLELIKWNNIPTCPYCSSQRSSKYHDTRYYTCLGCNNSYSVTVNTLFHDTKIPLVKWFTAIALILNAKKGISAFQLKRDMGIGSYKTAWRMLRLIRTTMQDKDMRNYFNKIVEMDETYVGGKPPKFATNRKRGRGTNKTPVVGIADRENKKVYAEIAQPNEEGKKLTGKQLLAILDKVVTDKTATVMTDEFRPYRILNRTDYTHNVVDHTREFVSGNVHTNRIESFWAILKRGIYGIYHSISAKYLQNYINEFCFRYNNRNELKAFDLILQGAMLLKAV